MSFAASIRSRKSKRSVALVSAAALLLSFMTVFASPAWAHNGTVSWDCDGWSINLANYNTGGTNEVTVTVDGNVVDSQSSNWASFSSSGTWDDTQTHTLVVDVTAWDDPSQTTHTLGSNSSFSPDWQHGEWSFKLSITQDACTTPPTDVSTTVVASSCSVGPQSQPGGSIDVTINPASGATVNVYSDAGHTNLVDSFTSSGSAGGLSPGTYYWEAVAANGYQLTGPSSGSVVIDNCDVTVNVSGVCQVTNGVAAGEIAVQVSVDDAATVEISDSTDTVIATLTQSGTTSVPISASYTWQATASSGFDLSGSTSGTVVIDDCTPPEETGEIIVEKVVQGEGSQTFEFTFNTTGFTLADNTLAHGQSSSSGPVAVGDGYSVSEVVPTGWKTPVATCDDGSDPSNIDVSADEVVTCTFTNELEAPVVGASILVTVGGTCVLSGNDGSGLITATVSVADGATVVVSDSDGGIVGTFSSDGSVTVPEGATYSWIATAHDGFEFPAGFDSSGTVTIETCSTAAELPFTGIFADQLATLGFVLLAAGVLVMTSGWYLLGWNDES